MPDGIQLLHRHVERFNAGVRDGDFGPMLAGFAEEAELRFEGIPVGPFTGRAAIAEAYEARPPDDQIRLLEAAERPDGTVVARYAWHAEPGVDAGGLELTARDGRITRLVVRYGGTAR
jgi:steroid delta-isomerase